jgi:hypothetical protein
MVNVIEFKSKKAYEKWLNKNGDDIDIIHVNTTNKKWSLFTGILTNKKIYTITYKEKK